ncbi:hypothetical protein H7X46_19095 [Pseudonocardia sp. C8]|uniref:DUF6153 family protein n=1 Tax=Pseudonocardia sp. C8 TaxID=2762759 RepID=UPI0016432C30|nr:DUF6153 family protein [Pseudonocardia sp. C8]MBC3193170.1 hypothetical protein [Pseudonocardia sp. C8]
MNGRHGLRLVLLVLPVLLGLIGMHALIAPAAPSPPADPGHTAAGHAVHRSTDHGAHRPDRPVTASPVTTGHEQPPAGHGDHDAAHLLHLCLAVLAAAGLALVSAWLFLGRLALPSSAAPARHRGRGIPAARPPPVPRRLAQLCVLRT